MSRSIGVRTLRRSRKHRGDDGASLVEFALVFPLFLLLLCAMVDFGLVFAGDTQLREAVNSGARLAAVAGPTDASCASATNPMACTILDRIGNPPGIVPGSVKLAISFPNASDVLVCAQATLQSATGFTSPVLNGHTVRVTSELVTEQTPNYAAYPTAGVSC